MSGGGIVVAGKVGKDLKSNVSGFIKDWFSFTLCHHTFENPFYFSCRGGKSTPNECPVYDSKQSDGEVPVMLGLWGMLSLLPSPLCPRMVVSDRVLSLNQIELKSVIMSNWIAWSRTILIFKLRTYAKLNCLKLNWFRCCVAIYTNMAMCEIDM